MFGPAGLFLAAGTGALKVMLGKGNNVTDLIPVDTVCNAIIAGSTMEAVVNINSCLAKY